MPVKKKVIKKVAMSAVQPAGPGLVFSKQSFFLPSRGPNGGKVSAPVVPVASAFQPNFTRFPQYEKPRRFVYDKSTGEAYAEWINNVAVCVITGQELFRSRDAPMTDGAEGGVEVPPFDYSVPKQRHPNDYSVSTDDMIASGFLSFEAFKAPDGAAVRLVDYEQYLERAKKAV